MDEDDGEEAPVLARSKRTANLSSSQPRKQLSCPAAPDVSRPIDDGHAEERRRSRPAPPCRPSRLRRKARCAARSSPLSLLSQPMRDCDLGLLRRGRTARGLAVGACGSRPCRPQRTRTAASAFQARHVSGFSGACVARSRPAARRARRRGGSGTRRGPAAPRCGALDRCCPRPARTCWPRSPSHPGRRAPGRAAGARRRRRRRAGPRGSGLRATRMAVHCPARGGGVCHALTLPGTVERARRRWQPASRARRESLRSETTASRTDRSAPKSSASWSSGRRRRACDVTRRPRAGAVG